MHANIAKLKMSFFPFCKVRKTLVPQQAVYSFSESSHSSMLEMDLMNIYALRVLQPKKKQNKDCAHLPYLTEMEFKVSLGGFGNVVSQLNGAGGVGGRGVTCRLAD